MNYFKNTTSHYFVFFVALFIFINYIFILPAIAAGTPSIMGYQGRLADPSGNLLGGSGTPYYFTFSIWDNSSIGSGNKLWPSTAPGTTTLTVRQGVFNVNIGDTGAGYPDTLDYNFSTTKDIYLQIQVSSDNVTFQTLGPRQRISAAAFAKLAGAVSGADTPSSFGTTTPNSATQVTIEATTTSSIALSLRARLNQIANLFEIKSSTGTNLFTVDNLGGVFSGSNLDVLGTSTLATTTVTSLTSSGSVFSSSTLAVTGQSFFYDVINTVANILPTTDITRSLGSNALRFLNIFSQNIFASSSVITNATSTNFFATNASTTNFFASNASTTNFFTSNVASTNFFTSNGTSTIFAAVTASTTNLTAYNASTTNLTVSGQTVLGAASSSALTATNLYSTTANIGTLTANNVSLPTHAGIDNLNSVTSNGNGTANIPANTASFYNDSNTVLSRHTIAESSSLSLTNLTTNHILADRDTDTWVATTSDSMVDYIRYIPYAEVFRSGNNLQIQVAPLRGNGEIESSFQRIEKTSRYARESGLDGLNVDGSLNITLNGGIVWSVNTPYTLLPVTTASTWFFVHHESGVWVSTHYSNTPVINNTQYDNGTDLVTISDGSYFTVNYIYRGIEDEDHLYIVLGSNEYINQDLAQASKIDFTPPEIISAHAMLVGRVIVQKDQIPLITEDAFTSDFSASSISNHNSLAGIQGGTTGEAYHLTAAEYTGTGTGTFVRATSSSLENTSLTNATSTNFFANILNAITSTINNLTGGTITATSSLTSNGTLDVTGTSTLATTTATSLTASGSIKASSTLAITGQSFFYDVINTVANILPTTDIARSLGSNALRFLNLFSQNIFASSSVITNATSTNFFATNASTTNLTVSGQMVLGAASSSAITATNLYSTTANIGTLTANNVSLPTHAGIDNLNSVTSNGNGTVNIPANTASFYNDSKTIISRHTITASTSLSLTNLTANYIIADRDTDTWVATTSSTAIDYVRYIPYAEVFRSGNSVHVQLSPLRGNGEIESSFQRIEKTSRYARESGLDGLNVDGSLNITLNGGVVWSVNTPYTILPVTTATTWFFAHHVSGVWVNTYHANTPVINNTQYDNGTDLATISDGSYFTVNYIYRGIEDQDHMYIVLGSNEYINQDLAQASKIDFTPPEIISSHAMLVGRVIVQKDQIPVVTEDAFTGDFFGASSISNHNSLAGIQGGTTGEAYHLTAAEYTGTGTGTFVRATSSSLENTSLTNATSTNFFANILNAITSTINTFTGGNITATSSLTSNGTLNVTATSTLATTTATSLTASGSIKASSTLAVTGQSFFYDVINTVANILPTTDITRSLGSNALRFLNLFSQNIYASSSQITNASSTGLTLGTGSSAAGRLYFANATNNFTTQLVSSSTQASNLTLTLPGTTGSAGDVLTSDGTGGMYFKSTTGGSLSGGIIGKLAVWSSPTSLTTGIILDNGTVAGINATSSTVAFNVRGVSGSTNTIFNVASSTNTSFFNILSNGNVGIGTTTPAALFAVNGNSYFGGNIIATGTINVAGISTLANVNSTTHSPISSLTSDLGTSLLRWNNLYVGNIYATSSVITNASSTGLTATNLYSTTASLGAITSTTISSTNHNPTTDNASALGTNALRWSNIFSNNVYASSSVITNASSTGLTATNLYSTTASLGAITSTTISSTNHNPTTDNASALGTNALRWSNIFSQNIFASSSVITNATSTNFFSSNAISTNFFTSNGTSTIFAAVTASTTNLTAYNASTTNLTVSGQMVLGAASSSAVTATNLYSTTANIGTLTANNVSLPTHAGIDNLNSVTSNGNGTVNIPANTASFYNDSNTVLSRHTIAASSSLSLTNLVANYIVADRDTNTWVATTSSTAIDYVRYIPYAEVFRSGNSVHVQLSPLKGNGEIESNFQRIEKTSRYARESGVDGLNVDGSLNITLNGGVVWSVNTPYTIPPVTTATTWFFVHHESGIWVNTYHANTPVINNTQYDNGTDLVTISDGSYFTVNYLYRGIEDQDHMYIVLGGHEYINQDLAQASKIDFVPPEIISSHAMLVGRVIVQKNVTSAYTEDAFTNNFSGVTSISNHNSLAGIQGGTTGEAYHLTAAEYTGTGTGTFVRATSSSLENTSLTNATSTNFFANILNAITSTINTFTGGNITATSSLTSNGTLNVTATSTLATTTATSLTASGSIKASSTLAVTGQSFFYDVINTVANILPTTDITRSLGSNALRFLNLFSQNIFASSSVITNATSTNFFTSNGTSTIFAAVTASTTNLTAYNASTTNLTVSGQMVLGAASSSAVTATNLYSTIANLGAITGTTISSTNHNPTTDNASALGTNALRWSNIFSNNIYASSSQITNASSTGLTLGTGSSAAGRLYFANATNNFTTQLVSSSTQASNLTLTLPGTTGSAGDVLTSDGTGGMYFKSTTGGSLSGGIIGKLAVWSSPTSLTTGIILDNGTVAGINATSSTVAFNVRGVSGSTNTIFNVASSTNTSFFAILSNGSIGVGSTTTNSKFSIIGGIGVSNEQLFDVASSTGDSIFHINSNGNVGIGTTTPAAKLDVAGNAYFDIANSTITGNKSLTIGSTGGQYGPTSLILKNEAGSNGPIFSTEGSSVNLIDFGFIPGSSAQQNIRLEARPASTFGTSNSAGEFQIGTAADPNIVIGAGSTIIMKGNVGIGTTTPAALFAVNGNSYFAGNITSTGTLNIAGLSTLANINSTTHSPIANLTSDLGTNLLRWSNIFSNNVYASSSQITNASSTGLTATNLYSTIANLGAITGTTISSTNHNPTTDNASALGTNLLRWSNIFSNNVYASSSVITNASSTGLTATNLYSTTANLGAITSTTISSTNHTPTTDNASALGTNALRWSNIFSNKVYASSSQITNASSSALTLGTGSSATGRLYFANASNNFTTQLVSSSTQAANLTLTLPGTNGSAGDMLTSDGAGGMYFKAGTAGGGYTTIATSTGSLTQRTKLSFLGTGITCIDNSGNTSTDCTVNSGGAAIAAGNTAGQIQFNVGGTGGSMGADSGFTFDTATDRLSIGTSTFITALYASTTSATSTAIFNQQGTGGLLTLQQGGIDKLTVANSGGLSIFAATSDTIKTTSGTTRTQDFSATGSTLQNVTSLNDTISIDAGTITNEGTIAVSSPSVTTSGAIGLGGHVILRDDGKYIIIHGGATTGVSIWNGSTSGAMSAAPTILNTAAGAGAISLKRPDGRYLVVKAGGSAGLTALYDPYGVTATAAGAVVCAGGAVTTGTNAILRTNGNYLIMCGGLTVTSMYNPTSNVVTVGPPLPSGTFGVGAHALQRDDGTFLIFKGGGTGTAIYNPNNSGTGVTTIGTMTDVTITNAPTIAVGASSLRQQDGTFLIIPGGINTSTLYDPKGTTASPNGTFTTQSGAGNGPSVALGEGAQVTWRQDGNYILTIGGAGVVTTNIVKPGAASGSIFVTTNAPSLSAGGAGAGMVTFMMPDGRYAIVKGGGTAVDYYNMGFVIGGSSSGTGTQSAYYESECIDNANINLSSVINWNANAEGVVTVEERTVTSPAACSTGTYNSVLRSGDLINPVATDNRIQFRVTFKREMPKFFDQEWGIRKSGETRYRRSNKDPALYDIGVANGIALHRTQFDFGDSTATSGPVSINISNNKDKNLGIMLEAGIGYGSTVGTAAGSGGIYNGTFNSNPALTTTATSGTVVMKRPDGHFVVISGNPTTANAQVYDPDLRTFTALGTAPASGTGYGALAFKRPDEKFLIVLGKASNATSIFDPVANTFTVGPTLTGLAGDGAQIIPLPTGKVLIIHGNYLSTTSIYDPIQNIMIGGPAPSTVVGQGSVVIPRPNGSFLFIPGTITAGCTALNAVTNNFDPYTMTFNAIAAPTLTGTGPGAFAFQRNDGLWVIVRGGSTITTCAALNGTQIYNPISNRIATGPTLSAVAQRGAHAIPRPDGTWLIIHGGSTAVNTTSIYLENAGLYTTDAGGPVGVFVAGPTLVTAAGAGSVSFQKDNGRIVTITGNAGAVVQEYDAGWVDKGVYKTEQFNLGTKLSTDSTLSWRANMYNGISAEVMTATSQDGLQNAQSNEIAKSGALINPGVSDTWLQINFNFVRKFPSFGGIFTDVWSDGGASYSYPLRKIDTPTLYEYKVTKDKNVIDLQSDGLSVFRVSSSGDVFTQVGGTINTSGADLAERYTSQEPLDFGEVVSIDPQNNHGVKKTIYQYQPDVLGVVSTDPGFVAGAYTTDSYPIALVGRVPVKVSTENGMIHTGDYLTSASVPGYAMKASLSGRVIGKALESIDESTLVDCPESNIIIPNRKCGKIMMFVNLIDFSGESVDVAMSNWKAKQSDISLASEDSGLTISTSSVSAIEAINQVNNQNNNVPNFSFSDDHSGEVLNFLDALKKERETSMGSKSELFADKISAVTEIISPKIITSILEARDGKFGTIEGLSMSLGTITAEKVITSSIASSNGGIVMELLPDGRLVMRRNKIVSNISSSASSSLINNSSTTLDSISQGTSSDITASSSELTLNASSTEPMVLGSSTSTIINASTTTETSTEENIQNLSSEDFVVSFDTSGNAFFAGDLIARKVSTGALEVSGPAKFNSGLEVTAIGTASTSVNILSDSIFFGRPYFTSDTGGGAIIKKGSRYVEIEFEREYIESPIINASIVFTSSTTNETIEKLFTEDIRFAVTKRTTKGFSIYLNKEIKEDITFNWVAFAINNSKEFTSRTSDQKDTIVIPDVKEQNINSTSTTTATSSVSELTASSTLEKEIITNESTTTIKGDEIIKNESSPNDNATSTIENDSNNNATTTITTNSEIIKDNSTTTVITNSETPKDNSTIIESKSVEPIVDTKNDLPPPLDIEQKTNVISSDINNVEEKTIVVPAF